MASARSLVGLLRSRSAVAGPLARARDGDGEAFAEFYADHHEDVLIFLTRRTASAETGLDLTAEAFAVALERRAQFRGTSVEEERGWLFTIARRLLIDYLRQGTIERSALRRLGVPHERFESPEIDRIDALAELTDARRELAAALAQLPADQRSAVALRVVGELEYPEIAEQLDITEATARARVSRGLRALKELV